MVFAFIFATIFAIDNKEFFDTVKEQRNAGYVWEHISCREVQNYPAITIDTDSGKKLVCNVLVPGE